MATEIPELTCYLVDGWDPHLQPASPTRKWMDETPYQYAYRCLPLSIANAWGWEALNPFPFQASWNGGMGKEALSIRAPIGTSRHLLPESLFGSGIITFHVFGLFRTSPGWNLWAGGSPNYFKDGVQALTGVIETDWSPYSFTMNWKMTRPGIVRFDRDEPICFIFPVQRDILNKMDPKIAPLNSNDDFRDQFSRWSKITDEFHERMVREPPTNTRDTWQKRYFRGLDMHGKSPIDDHQTKLRLKPFQKTTLESEKR